MWSALEEGRFLGRGLLKSGGAPPPIQSLLSKAWQKSSAGPGAFSSGSEID